MTPFRARAIRRPRADAMSGLRDVSRGTANAWECDHLGHMNTRFYLARVEEGLATLGALLGVPPARHRDGRSTLEVQETPMDLSSLWVLRRAKTAMMSSRPLQRWTGATGTSDLQAIRISV